MPNLAHIENEDYSLKDRETLKYCYNEINKDLINANAV